MFHFELPRSDRCVIRSSRSSIAGGLDLHANERHDAFHSHEVVIVPWSNDLGTINLTYPPTCPAVAISQVATSLPNSWAVTPPFDGATGFEIEPCGPLSSDDLRGTSANDTTNPYSISVLLPFLRRRPPERDPRRERGHALHDAEARFDSVGYSHFGFSPRYERGNLERLPATNSESLAFQLPSTAARKSVELGPSPVENVTGPKLRRVRPS